MIAPSRQQLDQMTTFRLHEAHVTALTDGEALFEAFGITTDLRMAHFLAQVLAETIGLSAVREDMTYTTPERIRAVFGTSRFPTLESAEAFVRRPQALAEKVYGGRLGNTQDGDGWRYRGGGLIQLTGRDNYREHGRLSGLPLEAQPELVEQPEASLRAALSYWKSLDINTWADRDDVLAVSRAVNRGNPQSRGEPHGLNDRIEYLRRARHVLNAPAGPAPADELTIGDTGDAVRALQEDLQNLTYLLGAVDGDFGLQTHRAVKLFEEEHGLTIDGVFTGADRQVLEAVKNQPVRAAEDRERALRTVTDEPQTDPVSPEGPDEPPAPGEREPDLPSRPGTLEPPTTHEAGSSPNGGFLAMILRLFGIGRRR
ncbi:MAG: peptidoglycan-binding protein [Pseudomonadota bacterium]